METSFEHVPIEQVAEFWNRRPCNIRHSPRPLGTREYFDEVDARRYLVEPHILRFAEFERWRGKRVLEIGCGIGTDTTRFARAGAQVTAVDLSTRSIEIARQRMELYGVADRVRFYAGSAEDLARVVPPETYDLIYSFGVIHHTPHPERVLEQIRQYVGPANDGEDHGLPPSFLESGLDSGDVRSRPILEARPTGRAILRGSNGLPDYVYLHASRSPRPARRPWPAASARCGWITFFPIAFRTTRNIAMCEIGIFVGCRRRFSMHSNGALAGTFASRQYRLKRRLKAARRIPSI